MYARDRDANQGPFEPMEPTSQRPFWHLYGLSGFKHSLLDAAKGLMLWQPDTHPHISPLASWSFLPSTAQSQIQIFFSRRIRFAHWSTPPTHWLAPLLP